MLLVGVALVNISCSSDEDGITPAEITNLTAESTSGRIVLRWDTPEDASIRYIEVSYYDHLLKKDAVRTASIYADSIEIPDTRKKYGEYQFSVQTVSPTGDKSAVQTISKVSEPALPTFVSTPIIPYCLNSIKSRLISSLVSVLSPNTSRLSMTTSFTSDPLSLPSFMRS